MITRNPSYPANSTRSTASISQSDDFLDAHWLFMHKDRIGMLKRVPGRKTKKSSVSYRKNMRLEWIELTLDIAKFSHDHVGDWICRAAPHRQEERRRGRRKRRTAAVVKLRMKRELLRKPLPTVLCYFYLCISDLLHEREYHKWPALQHFSSITEPRVQLLKHDRLSGDFKKCSSSESGVCLPAGSCQVCLQWTITQ